MLHEFLTDHRDELLSRTDVKVSKRPPPLGVKGRMHYGVPVFLTELGDILKAEAVSGTVSGAAVGTTATQHGRELLRQGYTVDQVVHTYGDVCQAVTELAHKLKFTISTDEFHTLNRALDDAIAGAVTEYSRQREQDISTDTTARLGLAFEQRSLLTSGILAWQMIKKGTVGVAGNTGAVLTRCLDGLRLLNNSAHSEQPIPEIAETED
jgi:hypothetical protein